jgi:hypothetical protein
LLGELLAPWEEVHLIERDLLHPIVEMELSTALLVDEVALCHALAVGDEELVVELDDDLLRRSLNCAGGLRLGGDKLTHGLITLSVLLAQTTTIVIAFW